MKIFITDGFITKLPVSFGGISATVEKASFLRCYYKLKDILQSYPDIKPIVIISTSYSVKDKFGLLPLGYLEKKKKHLERKFLKEMEKGMRKILKLVNKKEGRLAISSIIPLPKLVSPIFTTYGEVFRKFCLEVVESSNELIWDFNNDNEVTTPNTKLCVEHKSDKYPNSDQKKVKIGCFQQDMIHLKDSVEKKCGQEIFRVFRLLEEN